MGIGLIALIYAIFNMMGAPEGDHTASARLWSNLLVCGFFFIGIAVAALFFLALQHAAEAGWATMFKRVFEATSSYLYVGSAILVVVFLFGGHDLYHWMHADAVEHDALLAHKSAYLNPTFFWIRTIVYLGVWMFFMYLFRKLSLEEDEIGGTEIHFKNQKYAAIFLVFFGYSSSTASWDWIMSIDAHWFSTLFGWYVFSGIWISSLVFMTLLITWLKGKGYLPKVNENHIHDMGKWIFGVSCLWTYLWFSQFMLIWYANIPEEIVYFKARFDDYKVLYFGMIIINFVFPFFGLMDKSNKRNMGWVATIGVIIFITHWLDVYMMVTPGVMKDHWHFGGIEIGIFLGFLGLFLYTVLNTLSKSPLVVKNHPFLEECIHLEQN
ncbi:MAG: quinol:cytochrome C oxidoreductase [Flavobacteriales bacterium]|nr:quinol:cytochrome C oxidoreductase [Flavobacteriales bacterium]